jgi:predicted nuclease with TOPRIM domain
MAKITLKALKILAERIAKKVREEKEKEKFVLPRKVQKLIDEKNILNERMKHVQTEINVINQKVSDLGYAMHWKNNKFDCIPKNSYVKYINYEKEIFEELVLTNEFSTKDINDWSRCNFVHVADAMGSLLS